MNAGDRVKLLGLDERGQDLSGMTATVVACGPIYATVAVFAWGGQHATVLRYDCRSLEEGAQSVADWRRIHSTWEERNRRVIRRMFAKREAA